MKKLLLGPIAVAVGSFVAAPALAADPIQLGVSGYYQFYALAGATESNYALNGSSVQYKGLQFNQQGEIYFNGATKLDNGSTIGIRVMLQAWNPPVPTGANRTIDEAYLFAFGDWGRLEFGSKDGAGYTMYYGAPSALPGFGFFKHNTSYGFTNPVAQGFNTAAIRITGSVIDVEQEKPNRINFFTPRLSGLQLGASYAPKVQPKTQPGSIWGLAPGPGTNTGGVCGFSDATTASNCPVNDNSWQDAVELSANYLNKFGAVSMAAYGAYSFMTFSPSLSPVASAYNTINGANLSSWYQAVVGLQFYAYGFTVGASWGWDNNGLGRNAYTGGDNDTRTWAAGIMYETGPWQMSVGFALATNDNGNGVPSLATCAQGTTSSCTAAAATTSSAYFGSNPSTGAAGFGTVSASKIEIGVTYQLGPGVKLIGGGLINSLNGPSNAVAAQSWATMIGMDLHF